MSAVETTTFRPLSNIIAAEPGKEQEEAFRALLGTKLDLIEQEQEIIDYLDVFFEHHDGLPSRDYLIEHFKYQQKAFILEYIELLETVKPISLNDFKAKLKTHENRRKDTLFKDTLKDTALILQTGKKIGKYDLKGRNDAINYFTSQMQDFADHNETRQVGTLKSDAKTAWKRYIERKNDPLAAYGITSGFYNLDMTVKGGRPGELHFVLGFTSSGKSLFCTNYAYNAAVILGRNVVIFSLEMDKDQMMTNLYCIHSAHEKFRAVHPPVDKDSFTYGTLTEDEEDFLENYVIKDLHTNPEYGEILVEYPGESLTISALKSKLMAIQRTMDVEMLVVDYPELMSADKGQKFSDYSSTMNTVIKSLKQLAMTYNNGKKLFILAPYQSNRDGWDRASKNMGVYDLRAMSWASEAERACDQIYSVFKEQDSTNPNLIIAHLKNRRGALFDPFNLSVLWPSGYMNVGVPEEDLDMESFDWDTAF